MPNLSRITLRVNRKRLLSDRVLQTSFYTFGESRGITIKEIIAEAFDNALDTASLEAFEGTCSTEELSKLIDKQEIINQAWELILVQSK